jgi:hypothetical protein
MRGSECRSRWSPQYRPADDPGAWFAPPMIDLVLGYSQANPSPLLKTLLNKIDQLKFRVEKRGDA